MENFSINNYDQLMYNQSQISNSCRKKLNFSDQTNNIGEFDIKQKKFKKNSANMVSGTIQSVPQSQISNYTKQESQQHIKIPKIPSNTKRNARERKRVRTINDYFSQLQKFLPHSRQITNSNGSITTVTSNKKLSKVETLKAAIEYIEYLLAFAPMSNNTKVNLSSSLSSSPLSSVSSTNTTILSPASTMTSPATTTTTASSLNSSLNDKLKTSQQVKPINAQLISAQQKQSKPKQTKTEACSPNHYDNTLSPVSTVQSISQPQPTQCLIKESSNETILNPIDFNVNYNANTSSDYYYNQHHQQQCYNNNYYSTQFRSDFYVQQQQQQSTAQGLIGNQTNYYSQYNSLECSMDSSDQSMLNRSNNMTQLTSNSPSNLSPPETRTSPEFIQRPTTFTPNNYATINYNNQEQNLLLNTTNYNPMVEYQINC